MWILIRLLLRSGSTLFVEEASKAFQISAKEKKYTVGNLVLRRHASGAVKRDFRTYIQRYTSPNENFEYGYPHSYALLQFVLKLEHCKPHKAARHPIKCDVINDVKLFPTVYRRMYCRKILKLSNQTSRYKLMCIRIVYYCS